MKKNYSFQLHQVRLALQERPNWVWGRNLCGLVVGQARFQCWQVGDPPRFGGDHGTHPSIMILSWSDPVTYQPSPTTRAHHLPHPKPDMQVQSASRQFASPLAPLLLFRIFALPRSYPDIPREGTGDCVTQHKTPLACPMSL